MQKSVAIFCLVARALSALRQFQDEKGWRPASPVCCGGRRGVGRSISSAKTSMSSRAALFARPSSTASRPTLRARSTLLPADHFNQLDVKNKRGIRRNHGGRPALAIGHLTRNRELPL